MPNRVQRQIIVDALDNQDKLSEWEYEFIQDIANYPDHRDLSPKQNTVLNRIGTKIERES